MPTLTDDELSTFFQTQTQWKLAAGKLVREWTFPDFAAAMTFVNQVAAIAEERNHHPDIDIRYNRVHLSLISHDTGGLTKRDLGLAKSISLLE